MIQDFNLLATSERLRESEACSELWMLLRAAGDEDPAVDHSRIRGLITARTSLDPVEAVGKLRGELRAHPSHFRALLRVMPVETVVQTKPEEIVSATHGLASRIGRDESFRITVEKRGTELRSMEIIDAIAQGIDQRVDLGSPDWIVLVEIVGKLTGVSVIRREGLLNVQKEKAGLPAYG